MESLGVYADFTKEPVYLLTSDRLQHMINQKDEEVKQIKDFIKSNPYPNPTEMGQVKENTIWRIPSGKGYQQNP